MKLRRPTLSTRSRIPLLALLASCTLALPALSGSVNAQQSKEDVVKLKGDKEESGRIKSEDYGGIDFAPQKGQGHTIPWSDVVGVTYQGGEGYDAARELINQGKLDDALQALGDLLKPEAKLRGLLKQHVLFNVAALENRLGKPDAALDGFKALLKEFPKTRYLPDVADGLVSAYSAKADLDGARKALDELNTGATAAGVEANFSAILAVQRGRILERQKKWSEAFSAYNAALTTTGVTLLASQQARLGQARCQVEQKKPTEAEGLYKKITAEDAPNWVLAGAWNGLADLTKAEGREKRDANVLMDALFMYLRGVVQYGPVPGEPSNEYERALAGAAECFDNLSQVESNKDLKARYAKSRDERYAQLAREFPNSPYKK